MEGAENIGNPTRELAAIMFSDIVGYTAIMGRDEREGLRAVREHRAYLRAVLPQFNGRLIGEIGDGTLSSFPASRAVNYQRVSHTAAVSILFVPLQGRVTRLRPSPRNIAVAIRSAAVVQPCDRRVEVLAHAVEVAHLVEHAGRAALLAGAVVGHQAEKRVIEQAELFEKCNEAPNLRVGMIQHRRERLLQ